jgi:hypothetical protein
MDKHRLDKYVLAASIIMALDPDICTEEKNNYKQKDTELTRKGLERCIIGQLDGLTLAQYVDKYLKSHNFY